MPESRAALFALAFVCLSLGQYAYGRYLPAQSQTRANAHDRLPIRSKTNVYLISFESLHSPYAFRLLYGFDDTDHARYLRQQGFRVLDRAYSADMDTRSTYQRILEFSKFLQNQREMFGVFEVGNATFDSFRQSGYGVQFIYVSRYLNLKPGLVNHFFPDTGFYICDHLSRDFYYFVCRARIRTLISRALFDTDGKVSLEDEIAHLRERIRVAAADTRPWLTISHIDHPGHTDLDHKYDSIADRAEARAMVAKYTPPTAEYYRQIVSTIKELDPHAVIVTFGDHGTWLTRGMSSAESNGFFSANEFVEDRYGVLIGVYPAGFCINRIFEGSSTTLIVRNVIECLNGDDAPSAVERERSRSVAYKGELLTIDAILARSSKAGHETN